MSKINGINEHDNMNLCSKEYLRFYDSDLNHSKFLKEIFGVFQYKGTDYINPNNVQIEFKETFKYYNNNEKLIRFACYKKDYLESDYIVFITYHLGFPLCFIHKSKLILGKYKFDNKKQIGQPYFTTIRKNYLAKFDNLIDLKEYLDKLSKENKDCICKTCKFSFKCKECNPNDFHCSYEKSKVVHSTKLKCNKYKRK